MGIRKKRTTIHYGDDCILCSFPPFRRWALGETPKYIYVYFSAIGFCPYQAPEIPVNVPIRLTQSEAMPCVYRAVAYNRYSYFPVELDLYHLPSDSSWLTMNQTESYNLFSGHHIKCPYEYTYFENEFTSCSAWVLGTGGVAIISWHTIVNKLIDSFGLSPSSSLFVEEFPVDSSSAVVKLCDKRDGTNIKFLITPG
jgi:hypothetical protein